MEKFKIQANSKNIGLVAEYCIEERFEVTMIPDNKEDWTVEITVANIRKALHLGMFLKENKINLLDEAISQTKSSTKSVKKETKETTQENKEKRGENENIFSFVPENEEETTTNS